MALPQAPQFTLEPDDSNDVHSVTTAQEATEATTAPEAGETNDAKTSSVFLRAGTELGRAEQRFLP